MQTKKLADGSPFRAGAMLLPPATSSRHHHSALGGQCGGEVTGRGYGAAGPPLLYYEARRCAAFSQFMAARSEEDGWRGALWMPLVLRVDAV